MYHIISNRDLYNIYNETLATLAKERNKYNGINKKTNITDEDINNQFKILKNILDLNNGITKNSIINFDTRGLETLNQKYSNFIDQVEIKLIL